MTALAPAAAAPVAAFWPLADLPTGPTPPTRPYVVSDLPGGPSTWLLELTQPARATPVRAPFGIVGGLPIAAIALPPDLEDVALPVFRASDRGWTGEPDDAQAPNVAYPARLVEAPAIERGVPIYPERPRRSLLAAGEVLLANGDGALDHLAGNWRLGGRSLTLSRGPHWRPRHAPRSLFARVAEMRISGAFATSGGRLRVSLAGAELDLTMDVCATYGGTGGADGDEGVKGTALPRLYGMRRNIEPALENRALSLYRLHPGQISAILAVRDQGAPFSSAGDVPTRAALEAATVAAGTCLTCLAQGIFRIGNTAALLTVDARGDASSGYTGAAGLIAQRILAMSGGIPAARIGAFSWPVGEVGLYLRGGSVANALDALAAGVGAHWGADPFGVFGGGTILAPETAAVSAAIEPWMLSGEPEEVNAAEPPRWRSRVGYRPNGRVMGTDDLAGSVSDADRAVWGRASESAPEVGTVARRADYPMAQDPPQVESLFEDVADASAYALRLDELFGVPRRAWTVPLGRWTSGAMEPGATVTVRWPGVAALASGKRAVVRDVTLRGDAAELVVWG